MSGVSSLAPLDRAWLAKVVLEEKLLDGAWDPAGSLQLDAAIQRYEQLQSCASSGAVR